ncbi:hypothetical protein [Microvirga alba]|uniref:Cyclase dehydrase n=1 Tax=Microvirga alba TaxID=2791025 RepID=A0A931BUL9_9HYPH|nr:hypothetical protein [Microvirga alba]MBF9235034.1 hypothetical protein [Microvirga alba]
MAQVVEGRSRSRQATRSADSLARGLGWFSLALGVAELAAAGRAARWLGMERNETLLRACGIRQIATGVGVLARDDPAPWIRARLAGDALDLLVLGKGLTNINTERDRVALAIGAVAGVTIIDALCAKALRWRRYGRRDGWPPRRFVLRETPNM